MQHVYTILLGVTERFIRIPVAKGHGDVIMSHRYWPSTSRSFSPVHKEQLYGFVELHESRKCDINTQKNQGHKLKKTLKKNNNNNMWLYVFLVAYCLNDFHSDFASLSEIRGFYFWTNHLLHFNFRMLSLYQTKQQGVYLKRDLKRQRFLTGCFLCFFKIHMIKKLTFDLCILWYSW